MSRPVLLPVLLMLKALTAINCDTIYTDANAPFDDALKLCGDLGGNLPLPRTKYDSEQLAARLRNYGLNETWLDVQLQLFPWTSGQGSLMAERRDQGCFSGDDFQEAYAFAGYRFTRSRCVESCKTREKKYYGIKTSTFAWGDEIACMCGDDMTVYEQVGQKLCPWECSEAGGVESWCTTDRFYTWIFLVEGDVTEPQWSEGQEFLSNVETCGRYVRKEYIGAELQYQIQKYNCSAMLDVYCYLNYGSPVRAPEKMTWQRAHSYCESRDGHLPDIDEANRLYSVEVDSDIWTSLTARHWLDRQSDSNMEIDYSNWSDRISYSDEDTKQSRDKKCAVLRSDDSWDPYHCHTPVKSFICETYGADVIMTFSTTTPSTTTTTTTTTTTPVPVTQGGERSSSVNQSNGSGNNTESKGTSKADTSGNENRINTTPTKNPVDNPQERRDGFGSFATRNNYIGLTLWIPLTATLRQLSVWFTW